MTRCVFWSTSLSMASTFSNSAHTGRQQSSMSRHPEKVDTLATSETRTHQTEPTVVPWPMVLANSLQPQQKEMPPQKMTVISFFQSKLIWIVRCNAMLGHTVHGWCILFCTSIQQRVAGTAEASTEWVDSLGQIAICPRVCHAFSELIGLQDGDVLGKWKMKTD